ncbi:zinc-binding alcohol dehydrogenase family protein [Devosia sp. XK-2]|uniref:zinc-binding alcohol dehydrogenase family protein n=1 Tax=Devosia sp. XK-2 TaxID=3126689 RepID=UPI0030D224E2
MTANAALVVVNPGQLVLEDRDIPVASEGEVLVAPLRSGICGTDYHIYGGNQPFLSYPRVMGHELAVKVLEAPPDSGIEIGETYVVNPYVACGTCRACRKGKPNCCTRIAVLGVHRDGGMTKRLTLPARNLVPSEGLSADECAMVEFLAIGAHAVRRAAVNAEDEVLVVGAGPIGLGVARFAALAGAAVTLIDRDQSRLDMARKLIPGCKAVLAAQMDAKSPEAAEAFDVVFDATGNRESIETGFGYVAHGGRYCLVSVVKGDITFVDADFHRKEMTLIGSRNALAPDFKQVIGAIKAGHISSRDWITHRTTLAGAVDDLPLWAKDRSQLVKAIIEI